MNELDVNGRPLLLSVRVLKSTESEGLVLEAGRVLKIQLGTALKLIKLGFCERANKRKSNGKKRRARAAKLALLAMPTSLAIPAIVIERVV